MIKNYEDSGLNMDRFKYIDCVISEAREWEIVSVENINPATKRPEIVRVYALFGSISAAKKILDHCCYLDHYFLSSRGVEVFFNFLSKPLTNSEI